MPEYTLQDVAQRNGRGGNDCWLVIDGNVLDVTNFAAMHPGGEEMLLEYGGQEVTDEFYGLHRVEVLGKYAKRYKIGTVAGAKAVDVGSYGEANKVLSRVPFAEPSAFQGLPSPYYKASHVAFRQALRTFVEEELREEAEDCEQTGEHPSPEIHDACGKFGLLACMLGRGEHLKYVEGGLPGGVKPDEFDFFHELIAHEEMGRLSVPSFVDGIRAGFVIGAAPILNFGPQWMKEQMGVPVVRGEKRICLAISEPFAGSDVAALRTTARLSEDGTHYIVNGSKKWITNGVFADYFCTAVRTGKGGAGGISMLMIERSEGLATKPIKTSYNSCAGTAYITFENVKVPVRNLMGKENQGFAQVMFNFNHERWFIIAGFMSQMRYVVEESFKWATQRRVFKKMLIEQPVIRFKLAKMVSEVEAVYSWLESITFMMDSMSHLEQNKKLGGAIALCKFQCTRVAHSVADDSTQIFGGRAITKTGMGKFIERFERTYKYAAILGGSEEIMADLGIRQAMRVYPGGARL